MIFYDVYHDFFTGWQGSCKIDPAMAPVPSPPMTSAQLHALPAGKIPDVSGRAGHTF